MPLYEFVCPDCDDNFEKLVRSLAAVEEVTCPTCGSKNVRKKISNFASQVRGGSTSSSLSGSNCSTGSV